MNICRTIAGQHHVRIFNEGLCSPDRPQPSQVDQRQPAIGMQTFVQSAGKICFVCPRSLDQFYILSYYIKWVKTFLTDISTSDATYPISTVYVAQVVLISSSLLNFSKQNSIKRGGDVDCLSTLNVAWSDACRKKIQIFRHENRHVCSLHTVLPRSSDPFYVVTTSWTHSICLMY